MDYLEDVVVVNNILLGLFIFFVSNEPFLLIIQPTFTGNYTCVHAYVTCPQLPF